jgi:zinc and cadmium transporter
MSHWPLLLLTIYCLAIALVSVMGGVLSQRLHMTHTRIQLVMSVVSGLMLGVGFYHLLPHSIAELGGAQATDTAVWWLMIGLITMLLLLRLFHFHQHDFTHAGHAHHDPGGHAHHDHGLQQPGPAHPLSWIGIALGLALHTLIDGLALAAAVKGGASDSAAGALIGVGVFLAILLHKPLDAMSISTVMAAGGWSRAARTTTNVLFACMCPLGALLFLFGLDRFELAQHYLVGIALAFSAGAFICIALSDLLPEVHFHSHDRGKLTLAFILGLALAYGLGGLEPAGAHLPATAAVHPGPAGH